MRNCWVSILALVISVIALMLSYRVAPIDFKDYWGVVLGTLSLLVTLLIGWQIYGSLEMEKQMKDIRKLNLLLVNKMSEIDSQSLNLRAAVNFAQAASIMSQQPITAYKSLLVSLYYGLKAGDSDRVCSALGTMENICKALDTIDKERIPKDINDSLDVFNEKGENVVCEVKKHSEYLLIKDRYEKVEAEMKNVVERLKTCTK